MLIFTWTEPCQADRLSRTVCMNSRIQDRFPVSLIRSEPNVFDRERIFLSNIQFAASLGLTDFDPAAALDLANVHRRNFAQLQTKSNMAATSNSKPSDDFTS